MIVYLLRNNINGKCYVGKTTLNSVWPRWRQHKTEARIGRYDWPLYRDMRTFGIDAFEVIVLGEADCQRRLNQMERAFIHKFNAVAEGYNQAAASFGGRICKVRSTSNISLSRDHRLKIAEPVRRAWAERKAIA